MRTIFIDSEFKCYTSEDDSRTPIETNFFDGKCDAFIEGYKFNPSGEVIAPWIDYNILSAYQKQYEAMLSEIQDMQTALNNLGVTVDG